MPDGTLRRGDIRFENGVITGIGEKLEANGNESLEANGCIVSPGFIDIHIHGSVGADFCDGTEESVDKISEYLVENGVTGFMATTLSLPESVLAKAMKAADSYALKNKQGRALLLGINMEGPFFAKEKRGAQNADFIVSPDIEWFERLFAVSGERIKLVSVAPELPGASEFIKTASKYCRVSLAHTTADYETAKAAFSNGASHATHLFNAMPSMLHREPGVVPAAYEDADFIELITDGIHIHPAIIRTTFGMFGDRTCIISDAMRACGMQNGTYDLGGSTVTVSDGKAALEDGTLAGSAANQFQCFQRAVSFGVPIEKALKACTLSPAKAIGAEKLTGSLKPGLRADLLIIDGDMRLKSIFSGGVKAV